jgi:hypothetical protein
MQLRREVGDSVGPDGEVGQSRQREIGTWL